MEFSSCSLSILHRAQTLDITKSGQDIGIAFTLPRPYQDLAQGTLMATDVVTWVGRVGDNPNPRILSLQLLVL